MNEHNIAAVVSDIDGTQLIHGRTEMTPSVRAAARGLRTHGIPLLEVTSQSYPLFKGFVSQLDLRDNLATLDGGATIVRANSGDVMWSRWLTPKQVRTVASAIGPLCTQLFCEAEYRPLTPAALEQELQDPTALQNDAPSVFAVFPTVQDRTIMRRLRAIPGVRARSMTYENTTDLRCVQVTHASVDKYRGVLKMLQLSKLAGKKIWVIGDNDNDIPLFRAAGKNGVKVAMGNATDRLKALADYIAPTVEQDGFTHALRHYGLL